MDRNSEQYRFYIEVLQEELIPAMGCTEPVAIAYAAAKCRALLGAIPARCSMEVSGAIIRNVKSVIVPNTGGMKGMEVAIAAGIIGGEEEKELQVISAIPASSYEEIRRFAETAEIEIRRSEKDLLFYIDIACASEGHHARVVLAHHHTNVVFMEKDGEILLDRRDEVEQAAHKTDRSRMTVEDIWAFVQEVDIGDVEELITRQINCNRALSDEGLSGEWGARIGKVLQAESNGDVRILARAAAAAGSDARMNGCQLPAVIISGSGNQGITATMPLLVYAEHLQSDRDTLYRALVLSDLITIHQKTGIGSISAFCGAVCAGVGAGCGVAYLHGADLDTVCHVIANALAILSGMFCDGAKSSCAAKIAAAVDAGLFGYTMYRNGVQFYGGDGLVKKGVENTIRSVCRVAREGMDQTNDVILDVMLQ